MTCYSCFADVASTTVFCPHCGQRIQPDSGWQATGVLGQARSTTVLIADDGTIVISDEEAREVLGWLSAQREKARRNE